MTTDIPSGFGKLDAVRDIRENISSIERASGIYIHYVDESGLKLLEGVTPTDWVQFDNHKLGLVYIGKARNMNERIRWHLGFINTSHSCICHGTLSTLRHSYMANHAGITCLSQQDDLNGFLDQHVYIQYRLTEDYEHAEELMIDEYSPPLNIMGNRNSFIKTNKERRRKIKNAYREAFHC
jgi:hypothetical protein